MGFWNWLNAFFEKKFFLGELGENVLLPVKMDLPACESVKRPQVLRPAHSIFGLLKYSPSCSLFINSVNIITKQIVK
jgi:hypothetical protein